MCDRPPYARVATIRAAADKAGVPFFINARTDIFLGRGTPDLKDSVAAAIDRVAAYTAAGASGFFIPGLIDQALIRRIGEAVGLPAEVAHFKNDPLGLMQTLAREPGRENVYAVSADLVAMTEVTLPTDVLWLHLFYHDLHNALIKDKGATAEAFNRAVCKRLKPGGRYVIVDHAAAAGVIFLIRLTWETPRRRAASDRLPSVAASVSCSIRVSSSATVAQQAGRLAAACLPENAATPFPCR